MTISVSPVLDALTNATHPYYPLHITIPGYTPNEWSVPELLGTFFGACAILFASTYFVAKAVQPRLTRGELITTMWFVLSGCIHVFFEGYYITRFANLGTKQTAIGQMWKEYAFSDSRYLTQDAFVLCMESITAILWGPGCLLAAVLVVKRHPMRYPLQMVVSVGQFYGDVLYYATVAFDHWTKGWSYSRPERYYFWVYFVLMNWFWIVIPGYLIYQSAVTASRAIGSVQRMEASKKSH